MAGQNGPRRVTLAELQYHRNAKPPPPRYRNGDGRRCKHRGCRRRPNQYRPEGYCGAHLRCNKCFKRLAADELKRGVCEDCAPGARKEQVSCQTQKVRVT